MRALAVRCSLFAGRGLLVVARALRFAAARRSPRAARRDRREGDPASLHGQLATAGVPPCPRGRGSATERTNSRGVSQLQRSQRGGAGVRGIPARWALVAACLVAAACRSTSPPVTIGEHAIAP